MEAFRVRFSTSVRSVHTYCIARYRLDRTDLLLVATVLAFSEITDLQRPLSYVGLMRRIRVHTGPVQLSRLYALRTQCGYAYGACAKCDVWSMNQDLDHSEARQHQTARL